MTAIRRQRGAYRAAVGCLARGRAGAGFDRLAALGWVVELPDGPRQLRLARDYADARRAGRSVLAVSPTHAEGRAVTAAIRAELRARGELAADAGEVLQLESLNLTAAERAQPGYYRPGDVLEFHRHAPGVAAGTRLTVAAVAGGRVAARTAGGAAVEVPLGAADRFEVYRPAALPLAPGDRVRVTRNGRTRDRRGRVDNGAVFTVERMTAAAIVLAGGRALARDFGHLAHGYCVTSHAAQGKTVDRVFLCQGAGSSAATSAEQFYVSASRGRERVGVYTDDAAALRAAVCAFAPRPTATDLLRPPEPPDEERPVGRGRGAARGPERPVSRGGEVGR